VFRSNLITISEATLISHPSAIGVWHYSFALYSRKRGERRKRRKKEEENPKYSSRSVLPKQFVCSFSYLQFLNYKMERS
jgi:hypothetical protein